MENIFETLYYGPKPFERDEYQETERYHREASRTYDKLKSTLTDEQQMLLLQYADQVCIAHTKDEYLRYHGMKETCLCITTRIFSLI